MITSITGITNDMVKNALPIEAVLTDYLRFIGSDIILGHNIVSFDRNIIRRYCEELGLPNFFNAVVIKICRKYVRYIFM